MDKLLGPALFLFTLIGIYIVSKISFLSDTGMIITHILLLGLGLIGLMVILGDIIDYKDSL